MFRCSSDAAEIIGLCDAPWRFLDYWLENSPYYRLYSIVFCLSITQWKIVHNESFHCETFTAMADFINICPDLNIMNLVLPV